MKFSQSKAVNAHRPIFSPGACIKRKSPILTFLRFLSLKSLNAKGICQIKQRKWKWLCPFYYITPTSASSPWWCRPRCVGKSASAGINSPFKLNRACIPYNKRVEGEKDYFCCLPLHSLLNFFLHLFYILHILHFTCLLLILLTSYTSCWKMTVQKLPRSGLKFLKKIYSPLSFFLSFQTCFIPDYNR